MDLRRSLQGVLLFSLVGLAISLYLTWVYTQSKVALCLGASGCATVQSSPYAWILGIPIPTLGAVAYVIQTGLAILALRGDERQETWLLALFGVSLIGVLFSAYLTYLELFVINAICLWCVASAVVTVIVFGLALIAWRRFSQQPD